METWQVVVLSTYGAIVAVALARHFVLSYALRFVVFLKPETASRSPDELPTVAIFVPAKDEEANIAKCLRSILAQRNVRFELFAVDDRSGDRTAEIMDEIAATDPRLRVVRIREKPDGWTGKTNALYEAQKLAADAEWLLFVDADAVLHPGCAAATVRRAVDRKLDMFSMLPRLSVMSFWEGVVQPFASACLMMLFPFRKVNDPAHPESAFANGQYILIRRAAYDAVGGHAAVRTAFVEDINLARLVRQSGHALEVALGPEAFAVRMYSSLVESIRGWSRIYYSAADRRLGPVLSIAAFVIVFSVTAYAAVLGAGVLWLVGKGCPFTRTLFFMGLAHAVIQMTVFARVYRLTNSSLAYLPLRFLAVGVVLWILAKTARMCRTHRVEWRGTQYGKEMTG